MTKQEVWLLALMLQIFYISGWVNAEDNGSQSTELNHFLSISTETWKQPLFAANRRIEFEPTGFNLHYSITINDTWFLGAGVGRFDDTIRDGRLIGDFTNKSLNFGAGFIYNNWWLSFWYNQQKEETHLDNEGRVFAEITAEADYSAYAIELTRPFKDYEYASGSALLLEAGGNFEYQEQDSKQTIILRTERGSSAESNQFDGNGWLAGVTFSASYFYLLGGPEVATNDRNEIVATLSVNWSEPLTGDTQGSSVAGFRTREGRINRVRREQTVEDNEGSGQLEIRLSWLIGPLSLNAGVAFPFDSDFNGNTMDDQKSLYAGADIVF